MLCQNRLDSIAPSSCTCDVGLSPIPTWILLASLPFLYRAVSSSPRPKTKPAVRRWLAILQLLFAFALVAMQILEITRLALANEGVGLLPAVLVGLLIAAVLIGIRTGLWSRTGSSALLAISTALCAFWLLSVVFEAVRVSVFARQRNPGVMQYPTSDKLTDDAVMLAVYAILLVFEAVALLSARRARRQGEAGGMMLQD